MVQFCAEWPGYIVEMRSESWLFNRGGVSVGRWNGNTGWMDLGDAGHYESLMCGAGYEEVSCLMV